MSCSCTPVLIVCRPTLFGYVVLRLIDLFTFWRKKESNIRAKVNITAIFRRNVLTTISPLSNKASDHQIPLPQCGGCVKVVMSTNVNPTKEQLLVSKREWTFWNGCCFQKIVFPTAWHPCYRRVSDRQWNAHNRWPRPQRQPVFSFFFSFSDAVDIKQKKKGGIDWGSSSVKIQQCAESRGNASRPSAQLKAFSGREMFVFKWRDYRRQRVGGISRQTREFVICREVSTDLQRRSWRTLRLPRCYAYIRACQFEILGFLFVLYCF